MGSNPIMNFMINYESERYATVAEMLIAIRVGYRRILIIYYIFFVKITCTIVRIKRRKKGANYENKC